MEKEPKLTLNVEDGREVEVRRDNSSLFRFFGHNALYDHVFIVTNPEENAGMFIFTTNRSFEDIADFMMTHDFPAHLNLPEVADCDRNAFDNMVHTEATTDLDGGIPAEWLKSD